VVYVPKISNTSILFRLTLRDVLLDWDFVMFELVVNVYIIHMRLGLVLGLSEYMPLNPVAGDANG